MFFSTVFSLGLLFCSSSVAFPVEKRQVRPTDFQIVQGVLDGITQGIRKTNSDISNWRGDQRGANTILDDSEYLYRDILQGVQIVGTTSTVTTWDSTGFLSPANNLNSALDKLMNDLIKRKSQIDAINYTPIVRSQLLKLKDATDSLTKALFAKLPYAAAALARPVSNLISGKLDKGISAFPLPSSGSGSWWPSTGQSQPPPQAPPQQASPWAQTSQPQYQQNQPPYQQNQPQASPWRN